ncbi:hypothetical protein OAV13_00170 [bacterium]|nr:hypothetical protein [bacterium]
MINLVQNVVSEKEIETLSSWMYEPDHYFDNRTKAFSKNVDIKKDDWPKNLVLNILKKAGISQNLDLVLFIEQKENCFGLHADTSDGNQETLDKNIIIPLDFSQDSHTIIFKNKWLYSDVKFYNSENTENGDITLATEFDNNISIDKETHDRYLKHVDYINTKGLIIEYVYNWKLGDVFSFDRQHIHCAGYLNEPKKSIIIFTRKNSASFEE